MTIHVKRELRLPNTAGGELVISPGKYHAEQLDGGGGRFFKLRDASTGEEIGNVQLTMINEDTVAIS